MTALLSIILLLTGVFIYRKTKRPKSIPTDDMYYLDSDYQWKRR